MAGTGELTSRRNSLPALNAEAKKLLYSPTLQKYTLICIMWTSYPIHFVQPVGEHLLHISCLRNNAPMLSTSIWRSRIKCSLGQNGWIISIIIYLKNSWFLIGQQRTVKLSYQLNGEPNLDFSHSCQQNDVKESIMKKFWTRLRHITMTTRIIIDSLTPLI